MPKASNRSCSGNVAGGRCEGRSSAHQAHQDEVTESHCRQLVKSVDRLLADERDPVRAELLGRWRAALPSSKLELSERLLEGAAIVFATCAASTADRLHDAGIVPGFDWVVIEEAAKAWPTELAIPLVRGMRWTLIGDHFQLPAHQRDEIQRFLLDFAMTDGAYTSATGQHRCNHRNLRSIRPGFRPFGREHQSPGEPASLAIPHAPGHLGSRVSVVLPSGPSGHGR